MIQKAVFGALLAAASVAVLPANAATIGVDVIDDFYGNFSGYIADGVTDSSLTWQSAGYSWSGNIGLTDATGNIVYDIETSDDNYTLYGAGSGDALLGTGCVANSTACVVLANDTPTSLDDTIASVNGGFGICCGGSDIVVTANGLAAAVPETATWAMMLVGMGGIGFVMRRRQNVSVAYA